MARNDPSDTGGLFVGPRPGASAPVRLPDAPVRAASAASAPTAPWPGSSCAGDGAVPEPLRPPAAAWLWIGSQVEYITGNVALGFCTIILGCLASLMFTLAMAKRLDHAWKLARRAGGYPQERGALEWIFAVSVGVAAGCLRFLVPDHPGPGADPGPRHLMRAATAAPSHISA